MRLVWGTVIVFCLGFPASGVASQQETSGPANATGQASATGAPQAESQTKAKTGLKTEPKKKADAGAVSSNARRRVVGKRAPAPNGAPRKIVVREGGADEPTAQIVTGMPPEKANRQRQDAEQLLKSTDETLEQIAPRVLDGQQQETVSQIHNYMEGARAALKEGDIPRAHTLAVKAGLLADDLAKN